MAGVYETYDLLNPQAAPLELLGKVGIGSTRTSLETESKAGSISLEVCWRQQAFNDTQEKLAEFSSDEQACPFVVLPPESFYKIQLLAPESTFNQPWSGEYEQPLAGAYESRFLELEAFQRWFPRVETDLAPGKYEVIMSARARPTLAVVVRNSLHGPLIRRQPDIEKPHYEETFSGVFKPSSDRSNTVNTTYDAHETRIDGRDQTLYEPLCYTPPGKGEHDQTVEAVIVEATNVKGSEVSFYAPQEHGRGSLLRRYEMLEEAIVHPLPIAAFKFALRSA